MSIPGAEALMDLVRKIELSGRVYRGEPSREDMEMVRKSVDPVTSSRYTGNRELECT